jgi:DNA-binding NarL/FixJ family response regulator
MVSVTILLVDDHQLLRQGLRALLEVEPDIQVVGEAGDGLQGIQLVERLRPNVLVLDLMMPGVNGLEVTRQVSRRFPETRIIVLSMHANEAYVLEALRNGAVGYILKETGINDLVHAVREAIAGRRYLSPPLSARAIDSYVQKTEAAALDPYETLTTREREVLQLAAQGMTNAEIAGHLSISPRTAETHRANVMRKMGLNTQIDLIRFALKRGILPME